MKRRTPNSREKRNALKEKITKKAMVDYEGECNQFVRDKFHCFREALADGSFCNGCQNYTVEWILYQIEHKDKDTTCNLEWGCSNDEVRKCVDTMYEAMNAIWYIDYYEQTEAQKDDARAAFDAAISCQEHVKSAGLPLDGCGYDIEAFDEDINAHKVLYEAKLAGCQFEEASWNCPYPDLWSDPCSPDIENQIQDHVKCLGEHLHENVDACSTVIDMKDDYINELRMEGMNECMKISNLRATMSQCVDPAQVHVKSLKTKKDKKSALKNLLSKMLKELH